MSVKMETKLVVKIAGCTHKLTMEKANELYERIGAFIRGNAHCEDAKLVRNIQACVVKHFGLNAHTFAGRYRHQTYAWPKMIAMFLARDLTTRMSLSDIGNEFGRDHGTILYAIRQTANRIENEPAKRADVEAIRAKLNGNGVYRIAQK